HGDYKFTLGSSTQREAGSDNEHFFTPSGISVGNNRIYVADKGNARIQIFSMGGQYIDTLAIDCYAVEIGPTGNIYVADSPDHCIHIYSSSGDAIGVLGTNGESGNDNAHLNFPTGVGVGNDGKVYVADSMNHRVIVYNDIADHIADAVIGEVGVVGSDANHFNSPNSVTCWNDKIYVADSGNQRIQVFDPLGVYLQTIGATGKTGSDNLHFKTPNGVAVGCDGKIYIADRDNHRVVKITNVELQQMPVESVPLLPDDTSPPNEIEDLTIPNVGTNSVDLTWTAVGDDNANGTATCYEVGYSTTKITDIDGQNVHLAAQTLVPKAAGETEAVTITSLVENTEYWFIVVVYDEEGNFNSSNVPSATTAQSGGKEEENTSAEYGGTITLEHTSVDIPSGALAEDTPISIEREIVDPSNLDLGPNRSLASDIYVFGPEGTVFGEPVAITIPYSPAAIPEGWNIGIYGWNIDGQTGWSPAGLLEEQEVNSASSQITTHVDHFSRYAVLATTDSSAPSPTPSSPAPSSQLDPMLLLMLMLVPLVIIVGLALLLKK
ncbi:MAG: hypothetical protein KAT70_00715, partial [Thermoplasmata archaeon]|nr:hypothetical protein [Thermoplasmata archaeon]